MKLAGVILLSLIAASPAFAKPPKGKAAAKPPGPVAQSYAALAPGERITIQSDLIWTGDYNGLADGDFGELAVEAVRAYQKRNGGKETGVLNPQERANLSQSARSRQDAVGWRLVEDQVTSARLGIPAKLVPQSSQGQNGVKFSSSRGEVQVETFRVKEAGTTLQGVADQQKKQPGRAIDYAVIKPNLFVLSGTQGGVKKFYVRGEFKDGEVRGETILYDVATEGTMGRVVVAMSSAFVGFPSGPVAGPVIRKKVDYATGIIIDGSGQILTDRRATDGCFVITAAGLGPADRVADDEGAGLALIRVYGVRNLTPVPLAATGSATGDVIIAGIADPQTQGGGAQATTLKARQVSGGPNGPRSILDPIPAGFSGAAVIDEAGRLAGMVSLVPSVVANAAAGALPQASVVPSEAIRGFLDRAHVSPVDAPSRAAAEFTRGIVRVICARK